MRLLNQDSLIRVYPGNIRIYLLEHLVFVRIDIQFSERYLRMEGAIRQSIE